jgi:3-oxoacyl-[acyl-carrier-protein] synthase II
VEKFLDLPPQGYEVNAACAASGVGLQLGAQLIASGEQNCVLVCAADIVSRFTFMGFAALHALSPTVCRPFDEARDGLCLGDGAAAVLLVDQVTLDRQGCRPLARLSGWGAANDANHITGPARNGSGLIAAIEAALTRAGRAPDETDAFCAHGTGTVFNDAMELTAIEEVFGARRLPVFSIKGAVGHTLGAAGAMEAAVTVQALLERLAPPTAGLLRPEERAQGRVSASVQELSGQCALTTNSGFGGVNAALLFEGMV